MLKCNAKKIYSFVGYSFFSRFIVNKIASVLADQQQKQSQNQEYFEPFQAYFNVRKKIYNSDTTVYHKP